MSKIIDLEKKVGIVLEKRQIPNVVVRVGLAIDISGSMQGLYGNGTVQEVVDRVLAVACKFDDDRTLDVWTFNMRAQQLKSITEDSFDGYVKNGILGNGTVDKWGGTNYAPVMRDISNFYFKSGVSAVVAEAKGMFGKIGGLFGSKATAATATPSASTEMPAFIAFITDGDNDDETAALAELIKAQDLPIYWQFIGIGNAGFRFLQKAADDLPNAGFCRIKDIEKTSDNELFEMLLNEEMAEWVKK